MPLISNPNTLSSHQSQQFIFTQSVALSLVPIRPKRYRNHRTSQTLPLLRTSSTWWWLHLSCATSTWWQLLLHDADLGPGRKGLREWGRSSRKNSPLESDIAKHILPFCWYILFLLAYSLRFQGLELHIFRKRVPTICNVSLCWAIWRTRSLNQNPLFCRLESGPARFHGGYSRLRSLSYCSLDLYKVIDPLFNFFVWSLPIRLFVLVASCCYYIDCDLQNELLRVLYPVFLSLDTVLRLKKKSIYWVLVELGLNSEAQRCIRFDFVGKM